MATLTSNIPPGDLLGAVRGSITDASLTYPERMRLEVTDADGGLWRFATWYSDYSPTDPEQLAQKNVVDVGLDPESHVLTVSFADETCFTVTPVPDEEDDAIENWELCSPNGIVLSYGPKGRWKLARADEPTRPR